MTGGRDKCDHQGGKNGWSKRKEGQLRGGMRDRRLDEEGVISRRSKG